MSSPTRAVFGSAYNRTATDVIDFVKIMTLGNAVFGNLLANRMKHKVHQMVTEVYNVRF